MTPTNGTKSQADTPGTESSLAKIGGEKRKAKSSKRDLLRKRLERKGGARLTDLERTLGWQAHTIRAAISGLRRAGHDVQREAGVDGPVYRIVPAKADT